MMRLARQIAVVALVAVAVVVPIRAFAGSGGLAVSASLGHCGVSGANVMCLVNTSFNSVDGAEYYTAAVTRADGSVVSHGTVSPGGAGLWVSYVGPGVYTVHVTAWGYDEDGVPEVVESDQDAGELGDDPEGKPAKIFDGKPTGPRPSGKPITEPTDEGQQEDPAAPGATEEPAAAPDPAPEPKTASPPPEPAPEPAANLPACDELAAASGASAEGQTPPQPKQCATPAQSPAGPCCP